VCIAFTAESARAKFTSRATRNALLVYYHKGRIQNLQSTMAFNFTQANEMLRCTQYLTLIGWTFKLSLIDELNEGSDIDGHLYTRVSRETRCL
jgi:hypothetical protein